MPVIVNDTMKFCVTVIEKCFSVAHNLWVGPECTIDIFTAYPMFIRSCTTTGFKLAEHDVEIDTTHELVYFVT